jgi:hypothetical protein
LNINDKFVHPFGQGWRERNRVEEYLRLIFDAADRDDDLAWKQLKDELDFEQLQFIWKLLASHTRTKLKKLEEL